MLKWFRRLFESVNVRPTATPLNPIDKSEQQDPKVHESIKRTRTAFKQQEQQMNARALKPHSAACKDPLNCMKSKCFKWSPDKVASVPYTLNAKKEQQERKERQRKRNVE